MNSADCGLIAVALPVADISNFGASLKLWVGVANLQLSSFYNIIDWQKQCKI
jgi:hypothetical protein